MMRMSLSQLILESKESVQMLSGPSPLQRLIISCHALVQMGMLCCDKWPHLYKCKAVRLCLRLGTSRKWTAKVVVRQASVC